MSYDRIASDRRPSFGQALRRHLVIAIAAVLVCTMAGVLWGLRTPIRYGAEAQLIAGATGVTSGGLPAQAAASESLAGTYARVFSGDATQAALRERLGRAPSVAASAIPNSSVILIESTASTEARAIEAADAAVDALEATVAASTNNQPMIDAATTALRDANVRLANAQRALAAAEAARAALPRPDADPAVAEAVANASAAVMTAEAEVNAYETRFQKAISDSATVSTVRRLASAEIAYDTAMRRIQLRAGIGFVAGSALAAGLVLLLSATSHRRRLADRGADLL